MELAHHADVTRWTGLDVYFADPLTFSPWQRGTKEKTNGPLHQYFPKGKSLVEITCDDLDIVATNVKTRPGKALGYRPPGTAFNQVLH